MMKQKQGSSHEQPVERHSIPAPEDGGHQRSYAAHLGGPVHAQTKPADKMKQGVVSSELREPPMVVSRVGKQHK